MQVLLHYLREEVELRDQRRHLLAEPSPSPSGLGTWALGWPYCKFGDISASRKCLEDP